MKKLNFGNYFSSVNGLKLTLSTFALGTMLACSSIKPIKPYEGEIIRSMGFQDADGERVADLEYQDDWVEQSVDGDLLSFQQDSLRKKKPLGYKK